MKKILLSLSLLSLSSLGFSQWSDHIFEHDGLDREYNIYVPPNADPEEEFSLLLWLHGLGGSKNDAKNAYMAPFTSAGNVIILAPEAIDFESPIGSIGTAWNNGIELDLPMFGHIIVNEEIDDKGFLLELMDHVKSEYNIDENNIWGTGFSMGGFMTQYLACEAPDAFTHLGSYAGTRAEAMTVCNSLQMPIAHIHGTADETVTPEGEFPFPMVGDLKVGLSVEELVDYWKDKNNTDDEPIRGYWDDTNGDDIYIEHHFYDAADFNHRFEHFIVINGTHTYYGGGTQEFSVAGLLYDFFTRTEVPEPINVDELVQNDYTVYPNPASHTVQIQMEENIQSVNIYNLAGQLIKTVNNTKTIDVSDLSTQMYILEITDHNQQIHRQKFLKN